jgi:hypothetical protein
MSTIDELTTAITMENSSNTTDFPDYDMNESLSHFEWSELAPMLAIYSLTFLLGLAGEFFSSVSVYMRV